MGRILQRRQHVAGSAHGAPEIDLVPLIDCVFLMLLFFMLCGSISVDLRSEQISVPPAKTAWFGGGSGWKREIINLAARPGTGAISVGTRRFSAAPGRADGYPGLRALLDRVYAEAGKYSDAERRLRPKVVVELRADGDCDMRTVAEVMAVVANAVDPATMGARHGSQGFAQLDFTVRAVR